MAMLVAAEFISTGHAAIIANITESITGIVNIPTNATDFVVYDAGNETVRKNGGGNLISSIRSNSPAIDNGNVGTLFGLQWNNGSPITNGTSYSYQYLGFGPSFSPQATYAEVDMNMPSTSGNFTLWLLANPNTGSMSFNVTFGKVGDQFFNSYSAATDGKAIQFEFDLSEFIVNETLTFRVDNVSGSNSWHNIGFYGAQFIIPEPSTILMLILGLVAVIGCRRPGHT
jgi:hypothetical protein